MTLRKTESEKIYEEYKKNKYDGVCIFCKREGLIAEFQKWVLIENKFPYDRIAERHELLALKRHVANANELSKKELEELLWLESFLEYDMMILNKKRCRTLPNHLHFHLLKLKA